MVPPPATTVHTGLMVTTLPPASRPTAENSCVPLIASVTGFGETVIVATAPVVTVTVALPVMLPLVACTVLVKVPGAVPAVNMPAPEMAPPPATTDHIGESATMLPPASRPTAVNCCVPVMTSETGFGETVIVASGPVVTVTVAEPETAPLVARTVLENVPGAVPAVNRPAPVIVPPLATTDQVGETETTLPPASRPTTVNCCVPLMASDTGFGVTVIVASAPVVTVTVTVAAPDTLPLVAVTVLAKVPGTVPAVKSPAPSRVPPPATIDQAGAMATTLPPASRPTAVNCCVALIGSETGFGVTVIVDSAPVVTVTVAEPTPHRSRPSPCW